MKGKKKKFIYFKKKNRKKGEKKKKFDTCPPGIEPGKTDSESDVLSILLWRSLKYHGLKLILPIKCDTKNTNKNKKSGAETSNLCLPARVITVVLISMGRTDRQTSTNTLVSDKNTATKKYN